MRRFGGQPDALAQGWVRVNGLADVNLVGAHLDGQSDFANKIPGVRAHDPAAHNLVRFGVEQQLGKTL